MEREASRKAVSARPRVRGLGGKVGRTILNGHRKKPTQHREMMASTEHPARIRAAIIRGLLAKFRLP